MAVGTQEGQLDIDLKAAITRIFMGSLYEHNVTLRIKKRSHEKCIGVFRLRKYCRG